MCFFTASCNYITSMKNLRPLFQTQLIVYIVKFFNIIPKNAYTAVHQIEIGTVKNKQIVSV